MKRFVLALTLLSASLVLASCGGGGGAPAAVPSIGVSCLSSSVNVNGTVQCTALISNLSSTLANWQVNTVPSGNSTVGTIDTNGLYTAPKNVPTNNVVTITAVAQAQTSLTGNANITVLPAAAISSISCVDSVTHIASQTVASGLSLLCTATVAGGGAAGVNWFINSSAACSATLWQTGGVPGGNATLGTIVGSPQGNYVAPQIPPPGGTIEITAVSQVDSTQSLCIPITPTFGNASLQGNYAFSMSGAFPATSGFFLRAGSFTADGSGHMIGGIEDINPQPSGINQMPISFTGAYTIGSDGRGTMQFCEPSSTACTAPTSRFRVIVLSSHQAQLIAFDSTSTAVGTLDLQDASAFNNPSLIGTYTFSFSGPSSATTSESVIGEFVADGDPGHTGTGAITSGKLDVNNGGTISQLSINSTSSYSVSANGRGTATLVTSGPTFHFNFYMVSTGGATFLETDALPVLAGDAVKQQSIAPWGAGSLSGNVVFATAGNGPSGGIADLVSFASDGAGTILAGSGALDQNSGGAVTAASPFGGTYAIDTSGRGTITIPGHTYVFYMVSVGAAAIQETTSGIVATGSLVQPQGGPFTTASFLGSYGLGLGGVNAAKNEQDILGQLSSNGTGNVTSGSLDINNFGATQTGVPTIGTYTAVAANGRTTMLLNPTRNFVLYVVSPSLILAIGTDSTSVSAGTLFRQF